MNASTNDKLANYLSELDELRQARRKAVGRITGRLLWANNQIEAAELEMAGLVEQFNQPGRARGATRIVASLEVRAIEKAPLGPTGITWRRYRREAQRRNQEITRIRRPDSRDLARVTIDTMIRDQIEIRDRLKVLVKAANLCRSHIRAAMQVLEGGRQWRKLTEAVQQKGREKTAFPLTDVQAFRAELVGVATDRIWETHENLVAIEAELDKAIAKFNSIYPYKRNANLLVRWDFHGTKKERVCGPAGPYFYTLGLKDGQRRLFKLKAGGGSGIAGNYVTKEALKKRGIRLKHREFLEVGGQIRNLRKGLMEGQNQIHQLHKISNKLTDEEMI